MSLLARLNDAVVASLARVRRHRRVRRLPTPAKVNLGSGVVVAPGWLNVDVSVASLVASWPPALHRLVYRRIPATSAVKRDLTEDRFCEALRTGTFIHHDVRYGLPFPDESIDWIYSSHLLEHLYRSEALALLKEARRVLKRGGVVRICVPDLDHVVSLFGRGETARALEFFFADRDASGFTRHRYMWGFGSLRDALTAAGFTEVSRCRYGEGRTPDLSVLDNRPEETLYVEAVC